MSLWGVGFEVSFGVAYLSVTNRQLPRVSESRCKHSQLKQQVCLNAAMCPAMMLMD